MCPFQKSKAVRDESEQHLEALRCALGKADGMEIIFHEGICMDDLDGVILLRRWLFEQKACLNGKLTGRSKTVKALTPEQIHCLSTVEIKPQKAALEVA